MPRTDRKNRGVKGVQEVPQVKSNLGPPSHKARTVSTVSALVLNYYDSLLIIE